MKNRFLTFGLISGLLLLISSCGQSSSDALQSSNTDETVSSVAEIDNKMYPDTLNGLYSGDFGKSFLVLNLTYVNEHKAVGYDIHKGLQRNITGSVTERENDWLLVLEEPGDNPYDGIFTLEISKSDFSVKAVWKARNPKISTKTFTMKKIRKPDYDSKIAKEAYEQNRIVYDNFLSVMSECESELGDLEFLSDGSVILHHYPNNEESQETQQEKSIRGNWRWINGKVELDWEDNTILESTHQVVLIESNGDAGPGFKIGKVEFAPRYY